MTGVVTATGSQTFFGRTAKLVAARRRQVSHAQKAVLQIGDFLIVRRRGARAPVLVGVAGLSRHRAWPTTGAGTTRSASCSSCWSCWSPRSRWRCRRSCRSPWRSARWPCPSRRRSSRASPPIEEMAGVDMLCSDKTGTLTMNQLKLGDPILFAATEPEDVVFAGALATRLEQQDPIDTCVIEGAEGPERDQDRYKQTAFMPFDPVEQAHRGDGQRRAGPGRLPYAKGAPQAIVELRKLDPADVAAEGQGHRRRPRRAGYRALGGRPIRATAARPGRCSASCRCRTRRATTPRRRSTRSKAKGIARQDGHRRRRRHRQRDRQAARHGRPTSWSPATCSRTWTPTTSRPRSPTRSSGPTASPGSFPSTSTRSSRRCSSAAISSP